MYPDVKVEPDAIFTLEGPVCTSAGVTSGIDLALALVEQDEGAGIAAAIARELVVFLRRPGGQSQFSDALRPGSCRPWVALERRELSIAPDAKYRFRFEVTPPPGTPGGECVFAIMLEGLDTTKVEQGQINFPVAGRIGVIVYVQTGGAAPKLAISGSRLLVSKGERQPVIDVANAGNATGRLEGFLVAKDAFGNEFEMSPENVPIFPGRKRAISLFAVAQEGQKPPVIQYPLVVKGTLEWGKNRETLDRRFEP